MSDDTVTPEDDAAFDALPLHAQLTLRGGYEMAEGLASLGGLRFGAADLHFASALAWFSAAAVARAVLAAILVGGGGEVGASRP
jgi:hypothetical protein